MPAKQLMPLWTELTAGRTDTFVATPSGKAVILRSAIKGAFLDEYYQNSDLWNIYLMTDVGNILWCEHINGFTVAQQALRDTLKVAAGT